MKKVESTGTTLYHYDAGGLLIAETTEGGAALRDYLYLNGKLVAVYGCISGGTRMPAPEYDHTLLLTGEPPCRPAPPA